VELIGGVQDDQLGADSLRVRDQAADGCAVVQSEPFAVGDVQRPRERLGFLVDERGQASDRTRQAFLFDDQDRLTGLATFTASQQT